MRLCCGGVKLVKGGKVVKIVKEVKLVNDLSFSLTLFNPFNYFNHFNYFLSHKLSPLNDASAYNIITFIKYGTLSGCDAFYVLVETCADAVTGSV